MTEIERKAFGLNFSDVMVAIGGLQKTMVFECSGAIKQIGSRVVVKGHFQVGDRVMAIMPGGGWVGRIPVTRAQVGRLPDSITYEEVAETILIHTVTGGVGQAAIMLAQHIGAEIFRAVSTSEKRDTIV
ncbi:hypothetical protein F5B20DRAFT_575036 [Whalleya microplaca]|nr:hypothetical protein F5B20DRAFT_575036 [Whalleya microplaca]